MLTDYKIDWKKEDGEKVTISVSFYKGKITTENEVVVVDGKLKVESVTRYRRLGLLRTEILNFPAGITGDEIEITLNERLAKDRLREPIPEQLNA